MAPGSIKAIEAGGMDMRDVGTRSHEWLQQKKEVSSTCSYSTHKVCSETQSQELAAKERQLKKEARQAERQVTKSAVTMAIGSRILTAVSPLRVQIKKDMTA